MGTIVRNYDDWREKFAANIIDSLVGNAIQQQQQRDANRKYNAYQGELARQLQDATLPQIGQQQMPETNNGWVNAFRQGGNELANFDTNTASLLPPSMQTQSQQVTWPQQKTLTMDEIRNIATNLAATKRFSAMNPADVQAILKPHLDAAEQAQKDQKTKALADALMNAPDEIGKLNAMDSALVQGTITPQVWESGFKRYGLTRPQPTATDLGGSILREMYNPVTGEYSNPTTLARTLTPQQVLENAYRQKQFKEGIRQYDQNFAENQRQFNTTTTLQQQPKYNVVTADNQTWLVDQYGNRQKFDPNSIALSNFETQQIKDYRDTQKNLLTHRSELVKRREALLKQSPNGSPEIDEITQDISRIDNEIKSHDDKINSIYQSKINASQGQQNSSTQLKVGQNTPKVGAGMDIGANMISHSNNGVISTSYNTPRSKKDGTKYGHAGTDYPAPKGQPILLDDVGCPMTVTKVANDPNGYGNYVDLEGNLNGHKIGLRLAHMGDGTVKVQRGQTVYMGEQIGAVGNTGNSRGENGGYHLHLETTIDGQRVDPVKFKEQIASYISKERTDVPDAKRALYTNPNGDVVTAEDFNSLLSDGTSEQEADAQLRARGYTRRENVSPQSTQTTSAAQPTANVSIIPQEVSNDVSQDWRPSYQTVNSSLAMTGNSLNMKAPIAERRGLNNINDADKPEVPIPANEDTDFITTAYNPKTSPEKYPAPEYTDEINGTTAWQLQKQLDFLSGVADVNPAWSYAYRRQYPSLDDFVARYV